MQTPEQNNRRVTYFVRAALRCVRRGMRGADPTSLSLSEHTGRSLSVVFQTGIKKTCNYFIKALRVKFISIAILGGHLVRDAI
jgi:hypothetical protein